MGLIADTCFLVALERAAKSGRTEALAAILRRHSHERLFLTFTVLGELACGEDGPSPLWRRLTADFPVLPWTEPVSWQYGSLYRHLKSKGELIGTNDLWIAATALTHGHGVLTRNTSEFSRIPSLRVETLGD